MSKINTAWDQVSSNIFKTWLIMFFFTIFIIGVTYVFARGFGYGNLGGLGFVGIALIIAGIVNFISYYFSDSIVLSMSGAKPLNHDDNEQIGSFSSKEIYHLVENLGIAGGLPTPKIYILDDLSPNAFATGRDPKHSAIALTSGIINKLNKQELEGVIAHELSHVGNRDTLLMSVVAILVGTIAILSDIFMRSMWFGGRDRDRENNNGLFVILAIVAAILAPIVATLIQLAISRRREFLADASGVLLTRYPEGLENALLKISKDPEPVASANSGTAHMYIVNPLKGREVGSWFVNLFNTHPSIQDRVKALREMEGKI